MSEKTNLLPTAPVDFVQGGQATTSAPTQNKEPNYAIPMPRIIIAPGLEYDPTRKYRYGLHALASGILILVSFVIIELRDCNGGPFIDLDRLQALHISMMVFAFVLYFMSLFGIADYIFQFKYIFLFGVLLLYTFAGLMIWMTYEAAVNPCVKGPFAAPIDFNFTSNKNVFTRGDGVGIVVLFLDIFATISMISAASNFYKRY